MKLALHVVLMPLEAIERYTRLQSALRRTDRLHEISGGEPVACGYEDGRTSCVSETGTIYELDDRWSTALVSVTRDGLTSLYSEAGTLLFCSSGGGAPRGAIRGGSPPQWVENN